MLHSESFKDKANKALGQFLDFYASHFTITENYRLGNIELAALTEYHNRAQKSLLGIPVKVLGNESNEYGLYSIQEVFDAGVFEWGKQLILNGEQNLVHVHKEHAMSLISLIILTSRVTTDAASALKKCKLHFDYRQEGWCSARFVVYDVEEKKFYTNNEGKVLKNLLKRALDGQKL